MNCTSTHNLRTFRYPLWRSHGFNRWLNGNRHLNPWGTWQTDQTVGKLAKAHFNWQNTRYQCSIRNQSQDCIVIKPRRTYIYATCFIASNVRVRTLHERHLKYKHLYLHIYASLGNLCSWKNILIAGLRILLYFLAVHFPILIINRQEIQLIPYRKHSRSK